MVECGKYAEGKWASKTICEKVLLHHWRIWWKFLFCEPIFPRIFASAGWVENKQGIPTLYTLRMNSIFSIRILSMQFAFRDISQTFKKVSAKIKMKRVFGWIVSRLIEKALNTNISWVKYEFPNYVIIIMKNKTRIYGIREKLHFSSFVLMARMRITLNFIFPTSTSLIMLNHISFLF